MNTPFIKSVALMVMHAGNHVKGSSEKKRLQIPALTTSGRDAIPYKARKDLLIKRLPGRLTSHASRFRGFPVARGNANGCRASPTFELDVPDSREHPPVRQNQARAPNARFLARSVDEGTFPKTAFKIYDRVPLSMLLCFNCLQTPQATRGLSAHGKIPEAGVDLAE